MRSSATLSADHTAMLYLTSRQLLHAPRSLPTYLLDHRFSSNHPRVTCPLPDRPGQPISALAIRIASSPCQLTPTLVSRHRLSYLSASFCTCATHCLLAPHHHHQRPATFLITRSPTMLGLEPPSSAGDDLSAAQSPGVPGPALDRSPRPPQSHPRCKPIKCRFFASKKGRSFLLTPGVCTYFSWYFAYVWCCFSK
jgi:hypothetical protein